MMTEEAAEITTEAFCLPPVLDLFHVEELTSALLSAEQLPDTIDVSAVEKVTTPGIQLILSLLHTAKKLDCPLHFIGEMTAIIAAADCLGISLTDYLPQGAD